MSDLDFDRLIMSRDEERRNEAVAEDVPPRSKYRMEILNSPLKIRTFSTYDLEWYPDNYELRIIGVFDGEYYRSYTAVADFIKGELTPANHGRWFFAHAGGLADLPFIMEWMLREGYKRHGELYHLSGSFSGSAVTALDLARDRHHWLFLDSLWLLKDKLRSIAKSMGEEKGGEEVELDDDGKPVRDWVFDLRTNTSRWLPRHWRQFFAPFNELKAYNAKDCELLWRAISEFQNFLLARGGQMQRTYSACSFGLFRRQYLKEEFDCGAAVNEEAQGAYVASRVEVFNRDLRHGVSYDINSSFPYSMTFALPGRLLKTTNRLPDNDSYPFLAEVEIEVPEMDLPPLPMRLGDRVFFPVGRWRQWFTGVDIRLLQRVGGIIHKVHKCLEFAPWYDLKQFALDLYHERAAAKLRGDSFNALLLKYVLNGGYGKLAEGELKQGLVVNPPAGHVPSRDDMYVPGAYVVERKAIVRQRHIPAAAYITAYSRRWIYEYLEYLPKRYYCDTDCFVCDDDVPIDPSWVGENLGQIKLEKRIEEGRFVAPKVYRMDKLIKAKGFTNLTLKQWEDLIEYKEVELERMGRIKELWRIGEIKPQDIKIHKALNRHTMPKRFTFADGSTRPWSVGELYRKVIGGEL